MSVLQYASGTEIFQFLVALVGLCLAMWGSWIAFEDAVDLTHTPPEDLRRLVALSRMRSQLMRISAHGVLVMIGIVSVLLPPPSLLFSEVVPELEQATLVRYGLLLLTVILTLDAIMERKQRLYFMSRVQQAAAVQNVSVLVEGQEVARGEMHPTSPTKLGGNG